MKTKRRDARQVFGTGRWQALQDALARVTRLAIIAVDYKGVPVSRHSAPHPFCQPLRAQPRLAGYCQKCDSRGGLEAVRTGAPYIYLCHCGIVDVAIPILVEGQYIGALMAGQVRFCPEEQTELEQVAAAPAEPIFEDPRLRELYAAIPVLSAGELRSTADMLFCLCAYLAGAGADDGEAAADDPAKAAPPGPPPGDWPACENATLRPALDYIYRHRSEAVTQKQMADLCHVSTSYFSRLFSRTVGEGFTAFLARRRVAWSKELLAATELSVGQISDQLGFSSAGYFIKTFKRFEGVTPTTYRKGAAAPSNF